MVRAIPRSCTDEFKLEAVKLAKEVGVIETTRHLTISERTLSNWVTAWKKQTLFKDGKPKAEPPSIMGRSRQFHDLARATHR